MLTHTIARTRSAYKERCIPYLKERTSHHLAYAERNKAKERAYSTTLLHAHSLVRSLIRVPQASVQAPRESRMMGNYHVWFGDKWD